jgi:hypothetical protein
MADNTIKNVEKTYTDPATGKFVEGNPGGGRPKGSGISITTAIKNKLEEVPEGQKATYLELLISRIMKQAIQDGDQQMIKNIWNYVDGMPKQSTDITSDGEKLDFKVISYKDVKNGQ